MNTCRQRLIASDIASDVAGASLATVQFFFPYFVPYFGMSPATQNVQFLIGLCFRWRLFGGEEGKKESAGDSAGDGEEGEKESAGDGEGEVERKKIKKN